MKQDNTVKAARRSLKNTSAYQKVFGTPDGKLVLQDLMQAHHMLNSTLGQDLNSTLVQEGERRVVLRILSILKMDVNHLHERIEEYAREND